jgi:small-conductance mechanosensitive channel
MLSPALRRLIALAAMCAAALWSLSAVMVKAQEDPWFEIDALNAGLAQPGPEVDRRTPRATLQTFLESAEAGAWDRAAHVLDLGDLAPEAQAGAAASLAARLHSVIDRKAVLDWAALNDRPDGLQVLGGNAQAQAGEPRRSFLLRDMDLDPVPASIRLTRVRPGEQGEPVWVFDRATVADIPALYEAYGPSRFELALPSALRGDAIWGLMWWELLGLPLLVFAAGLLAVSLKRLFDWLSARTSRDLSGRILLALRTPAIVAAVTALVAWVTGNVFVFSGTIDVFLAPIIAVGYVSAILLLIVNVIEAALDHLVAPGSDIDLTDSTRGQARKTATRLNAAKRILVIVVTLIGAGVVLSTADIFRGLGLSLLASAGALTLVLGFAARRILGNILASLQIALNQSARVGDRVVFKGELCHVERIHMTFVQLKHWEGTRLIVPVEEFVSETFSNWTLEETPMLRNLEFKLAPSADIQALREAFLEIMRDLKQELGDDVGDLDEAGVKVTGQDVFGLDVLFLVPCADPNSSWTVACTARERLVARAVEMERSREVQVFPEAAAAEAA